MRWKAAAIVLVAALPAAGCDRLTEPAAGWRVVGIIEWQPPAGGLATAGVDLGSYSALLAPDTVQAGVPFTATVTTIGMTGCVRQDGAFTAGAAGMLVITPFDLVAMRDERGPAECAGSVVLLPRTVHLVLTQPGPATLRLQGRRITGTAVTGGAPAVVDRTIVVR